MTVFIEIVFLFGHPKIYKNNIIFHTFLTPIILDIRMQTVDTDCMFLGIKNYYFYASFSELCVLATGDFCESLATLINIEQFNLKSCTCVIDTFFIWVVY